MGAGWGASKVIQWPGVGYVKASRSIWRAEMVFPSAGGGVGGSVRGAGGGRVDREECEVV